MDFENSLELREFKMTSNCLAAIRGQVEFMLDTCDWKLFPDKFYLMCRKLLVDVKDCQCEYSSLIKFTINDISYETELY